MDPIGYPGVTVFGGPGAVRESVVNQVQQILNGPGALPNSTSADGYRYTAWDSKVLIEGYTGPDDDITIPATIDGCTVVGIGDDVFAYCSSLTSVTIPDSVTSIGSYAFNDCTGLRSVTLPDSLTSIRR
ncbi:MAG TPA: leucine-rich repeat domain-containing protein [Desulfitobacteriaceae bacterium]|nr:leucine-rich repeat domain-containing protein [Desulfitobacteriaceae bacterium]